MLNIAGPSYTLGTIAGIPVKVHWTFGLLLLFVGYLAYSNGIPTEDIGWFFAYVGLLFVFVIMHEFGHALTARRFGVTTRDVIISPIGGVARLESIPSKPIQELLVAIAGPAVNVVLVIVFVVVQVISDHSILPQGERINLIASPADFISYLLVMNGVLVVFNMVPAFPMDGGRVLRALLAMITGNRLKATRISSFIGQLFAVVFIGYGFSESHYVLMFIGLFVFMSARAEYRQLKLSALLNDTTVSEVMSQQFTKLSISDPISRAFDYPGQQNFLVADELGRVVGTLPSLFIDDAKERGDTDTPIRHRMSGALGSLGADMNLKTAFQAMNQYGWAIAPIVDAQNEIIGVLSREHIEEVLKRR